MGRGLFQITDDSRVKKPAEDSGGACEETPTIVDADTVKVAGKRGFQLSVFNVQTHSHVPVG